MKLNAKKIAYSAVLLAICIMSMFFKNANVYLTGSVVNTCLILIVLMGGLASGIIASIVTPIFSFIITGSPIIAAIPIIMPMIMVGNIILCSFVGIFDKNTKGKSIKRIFLPMIVGSIVKALFMGIVISLIIVPIFLPEKMQMMLPAVQATFSVTQLITSLIASVISIILYRAFNEVNI